MDLKTELQVIMSKYCPYAYRDIRMDLPIKDRYVPYEFMHDFADDICNKWEDVRCTDVHNDMFGALRTGNDIINKLISEGYEDSHSA